MINDATLNNFLTKSDLILCSETAGQGRARQYCLVDAYQIALLRRLSLLTGRVAWSASALNHFLFEDVYATHPLDGKIERIPATKELKKNFCEDINSLPQAYKDRDGPWFFFADVISLSTTYARLSCARWDDGDRVLKSVLASGVHLNVTYLLEFVDAELATALNLELNDDA